MFLGKIRKITGGYAGDKQRFSHPSAFFLIVASIFGLLFVFLTPPLQGPDEQAHFVQVYKFSEGNLNSKEDIPRSIGETFQTVMYEDDIRFDGNQKYELGRTKHALLEIDLQSSGRDISGSHSGTGYPLVAYLPQTLLVLLGRIIDLPVVLLIYLARLGSLVLFIGLMYAAIRTIPVAKWPFAVIGLLPMSLFSASMISADALSLGSIGLFIALVVSLFLRTKTLDWKVSFITILVTIALVSAKLINVVLLPLFLILLLKKRNKSYKQYVLLIAGAVLAAVFALGVTQVIAASQPVETVTNMPKNVVPAEQIKLIILAPQKFAFALWNTYVFAWGDTIFYSLIGAFGWMDTSMALPFVILGFVMLALVFTANRSDDYTSLKWSKKQKWVIATVTLGFFLAVNAAMFIFYSPVDFNIIVGLQGRYFLPILFLLSLLLINTNMIKIHESTYDRLVRILPLVLLSVAVMYVFIRYYVDTKI